MKRLLLLLAMVTGPAVASVPCFRVEGTDPEPWRKIFQAVNVPECENASLIVLGPASKADAQVLSQDHFVILEGTGFNAQSGQISIRQIRDTHAPGTQIIWQEPQSVAETQLPSDYTVFATERWKNAAVLAGKRTAQGALLWLATSPGAQGYERYPYLLQAAADLGLQLPVKSTDIWAFFDSSYRIRADVDYLAKRWRASGISALQVAAWHNMDDDATQDEYLQKLIEACHRNAILVYAWLELPHVSEKFWERHPEWREKTALGQDAQLDWRKLMNMQNPACQREAARQITSMLQRFDWDGVNVAELYFESLEGASNPARFTPMNDAVRAEFREIGGFDPQLLFDPTSPYAHNPAALRKFLDYRAVLAARMQEDWLKELDAARRSKPYLDIVLTHVDDRFDKATRDELGADVARSLPLMRRYRSTLLVEDPATLWDLGPERYNKLAQKYQELSPSTNDVAVDINVVERYQDVYPTKKQTGVELLQLVHQASSSFAAVALYGENSLDKQDLPLLPVAAAAASVDLSGGEVQVQSKKAIQFSWSGPALVDGKQWPFTDGQSIRLPAGKHLLSAAATGPAVSISDFNGNVRSVFASPGSVDIGYQAKSRAILVLGSAVSKVELDGQIIPASDGLLLPAGQHVLTLTR